MRACQIVTADDPLAFDCREKHLLKSDHHLLSGPAARLDEFPDLLRTCGRRLFHPHVAAGLQRIEG